MKIAVVATVWFPFSHADVIVSRWLKPFPTDCQSGWEPTTQIASLFIEQTPENEIGSAVCAEAGVPIFKTIREALTLGGEALAVDAVILIGEHGEYPENEYLQKLYPRKRLFDAIVDVFRATGRSVPVFNDKHLSWSFEESAAMVATAREVGFPLYGGSSIPHCPILPERPLLPGETTREALSVYYGHLEHYGYHAIEFAMAMLECRAGGETGIRAVRAVRAVQAVSGCSSPEAIAAEGVPLDLLHAAFVNAGFPDDEETVAFVLRRSEQFTLYQLEHLDGTRVHHLHLNRTIAGWYLALRTEGGILRACHSAAGDAGNFYNNFAQLNRCIQTFFETGTPPNNILRTHLTAGALERALHALRDTPGQWIDTPELAINTSGC